MMMNQNIDDVDREQDDGADDEREDEDGGVEMLRIRRKKKI
jgi:hypothetical protein